MPLTKNVPELCEHEEQQGLLELYGLIQIALPLIHLSIQATLSGGAPEHEQNALSLNNTEHKTLRCSCKSLVRAGGSKFEPTSARAVRTGCILTG